MSLADELKQLTELHGAGALSDAEFARAKEAALARYEQPVPGATASDPYAQLQSLQVTNNSLRLIDMDWERERQQYLMTTKYGFKYEPAFWHAALIAALGIFIGAVSLTSAEPWFGVLAIVAGLGYAGYTAHLANGLETARHRYQERRSAAIKFPPASPPHEDGGIHIVP